jgi:tRNA(Arg) A34 adenosine deaminase TadA
MSASSLQIMLAETRDRKLYYRAARLCLQSDYHIRCGALAAVNSKVLAGAFNTVRNDAKNTPYGTATYHAEFNCLRMVPDRLLTRTTLYVARVDKAGKRMPSRPCNRCMGELELKGIRVVVYFDGEFIIKEKL